MNNCLRETDNRDLQEVTNYYRDRIEALRQQNDRLKKALTAYYQRGHHDTCSNMKSSYHACDCGHALAELIFDEKTRT